MNILRILAIVVWISLPTVMYGGYALLGFITRGNQLSAFQEQFFRAGHAHAGVLLLMSLLYYIFLERTAFSTAVKAGAFIVLVVGILAQSGGFFLHMLVGQPGQPSLGTAVTTAGAVLLGGAILLLAYGLITAP